jgi:hypothetical protein
VLCVGRWSIKGLMCNLLVKYGVVYNLTSPVLSEKNVRVGVESPRVGHHTVALSSKRIRNGEGTLAIYCGC